MSSNQDRRSSDELAANRGRLQPRRNCGAVDAIEVHELHSNDLPDLWRLPQSSRVADDAAIHGHRAFVVLRKLGAHEAASPRLFLLQRRL